MALVALPARADLPMLGQTKVDHRQIAVRAIAADAEGFLWVLSEAGLCRFDGRIWVCPRSACEGALLGSGAGSVWALCDGANLLQVKGDHLTSFALPNGMTGGAALVGAMDQGVFLANGTGTYAWNPGQPLRRLSDEPAVSAARWGTTTWLTSARGLIRVEGEGRPEVVLDRPTTLLALSAKGEAFVRVGHIQDAGEVVMLTAQGTLTSARFETRQGFITSLSVDDAHGLLWLIESGGLVGYEMHGGSARVVRDMRDGLPDPRIAAQFRDAQGLWLGTMQGLAQLRIDPPIFNVGRPEGMDGDSVFSVTATRDGAVWMTQGNGLTRYEDGRVYNAAARDGLVHIDLRSVAVTPDGSVWSAGLVNTLVRLSLTTNRFAPVTMKRQPETFSVHPLHVGPTGTLWMGVGDGGLGKLQGESFVSVLPGEAGTHNRVFALIEDATGTVWFTRRDGTVIAAKDDRVANYKLPPDAMGTSLYRDALGNVWVGTEGDGLFRIKQGRVSQLTTHHGLWEDRIHAVIEDGHGWLWMSSPRGVFRVLLSQANAAMDGWAPRVDAIAYQIEDGMRSDAASLGFSPSCARDAKGRLWFAMVGGAVVFDPQALAQAPPPHSVYVQAVQVDGLDVRASGVAMPAGNGALTFTYSAPTLWDPSRIRYRVRLGGWDNTWVEQGQSTRAAYLGVPPGRYKFEVQALSWDRPELKAHAAWTLELLPPFYRRGWFGAAVGLLLVGIAALAVREKRVRNARLQAALFADRTRIAQDIHDSLEQDLCGMKMHVDAANLWLDKDGERARTHLGRAAELVSDGMVDMRTAVWGLRAGWVRGVELAQGLEQRLQRIAHAAQLELEFSTLGDPTTLPSLVATQIFYIAREAMTNAVKHARATRIQVRLDFRTSRRVILMVEDDGVGISDGPSGAREGGLLGGVGLDGMRARAALVGGELRVTSSPAGTSVVVDVGLHEPGSLSS